MLSECHPLVSQKIPRHLSSQEIWRVLGGLCQERDNDQISVSCYKSQYHSLSFWNCHLNVDIPLDVPYKPICFHFISRLELFLWFHRCLIVSMIDLNSWCSHPWDYVFSWELRLLIVTEIQCARDIPGSVPTIWRALTSFHLFESPEQKVQMFSPFHTPETQSDLVPGPKFNS